MQPGSCWSLKTEHSSVDVDGADGWVGELNTHHVIQAFFFPPCDMLTR